ncbi:hypothetical protein JCM8547_006744 [Rhodosporidiobolus lusitaniae]
MDPSPSSSTGGTNNNLAPPVSSTSSHLFSQSQQQQQQQQQQQHQSQQLPSPSPVSPSFPPGTGSSSGDQSSSGPSGLSSSATLPPTASTSSTASPLPSGGPPLAPKGPVTRSGGPAIVSYDPNNTEGGSDDDDDDEDGAGGSPKKKRKGAGGKATAGGGKSGSAAGDEPEKGRRKIEIEYIQKKEKRHITFSKRKAGIMKKAYELATLTGTEVLLLVVSETGIVYTFTTTKFQPLVGATESGAPSEGQRLIQQCLAVSPEDEHNSDYISPPPDGPLLPLPPSAQKRPFEANSSIHGGQIALRTKQHRPRNKRPAPIVPPGTGPAGSASLPTPSIHAQMDAMQNMPMSPHQLHPLNPAPPGSLRDYPPSPGFPPHQQPPMGPGRGANELPTPLQPAPPGPHEGWDGMHDRAAMNGQYGPPVSYPPPPALGYTHQLPQPPPPGNRPPHPLDPYPPHHQHGGGSPSSSPRQPRHLPPPPYLGGNDPYAQHDHQQRQGGYSTGPPPPGEDTRMLSPYQRPAQPPGRNDQLPNPPPEMYMQHGGHQLPQPPPQHQQQQYRDGQDSYMRG